MRDNVYEGMFILDSNSYARDAAALSGRVVEMIEKHGGEILASRLWAEQKLAYPINGQRKGTYWLTYFRIESTRLVELNRAARINDDILRSLVLKIDPRLVDPMVTHALQGKSTPEAEGSEDGGEKAETDKPQTEKPAGEEAEASEAEASEVKASEVKAEA